MFKCIFKLIFAKEIKEIFSRLKQKYEDLLKLYIHKEECYQESLKTIDGLRDKVDKLQKQIDKLEDLINSNSNFLPNEFVVELMQILPSPNMLNLTTRETKNLKAVGISMDDVTILVKPFKSKIKIPRKFHEFNYNMMGVQSQVTTYYWDMSSIKLLSMKEIETMEQFAIAERNVLSDFRAENILF